MSKSFLRRSDYQKVEVVELDLLATAPADIRTEQTRKRKRIEDHAHKYLGGKHLAIHSARLRGPFISPWKSPWKHGGEIRLAEKERPKARTGGPMPKTAPSAKHVQRDPNPAELPAESMVQVQKTILSVEHVHDLNPAVPPVETIDPSWLIRRASPISPRNDHDDIVSTPSKPPPLPTCSPPISVAITQRSSRPRFPLGLVNDPLKIPSTSSNVLSQLGSEAYATPESSAANSPQSCRGNMFGEGSDCLPQVDCDDLHAPIFRSSGWTAINTPRRLPQAEASETGHKFSSNEPAHKQHDPPADYSLLHSQRPPASSSARKDSPAEERTVHHTRRPSHPNKANSSTILSETATSNPPDLSSPVSSRPPKPIDTPNPVQWPRSEPVTPRKPSKHTATLTSRPDGNAFLKNAYFIRGRWFCPSCPQNPVGYSSKTTLQRHVSQRHIVKNPHSVARVSLTPNIRDFDDRGTRPGGFDDISPTVESNHPDTDNAREQFRVEKTTPRNQAVGGNGNNSRPPKLLDTVSQKPISRTSLDIKSKVDASIRSSGHKTVPNGPELCKVFNKTPSPNTTPKQKNNSSSCDSPKVIEPVFTDVNPNHSSPSVSVCGKTRPPTLVNPQLDGQASSSRIGCNLDSAIETDLICTQMESALPKTALKSHTSQNSAKHMSFSSEVSIISPSSLAVHSASSPVKRFRENIKPILVSSDQKRSSQHRVLKPKRSSLKSLREDAFRSDQPHSAEEEDSRIVKPPSPGGQAEAGTAASETATGANEQRPVRTEHAQEEDGSSSRKDRIDVLGDMDLDIEEVLDSASLFLQV